MKTLAALVLALMLGPAFAQPGPGPGMRQMPPPERRMSWEERQRLREQVQKGEMSRDEARQRWRESREQRGVGPGRSPEERQRLRRDVQEANRDLGRR
ncbi:MAG: hypothetical protein ABI654_05715 [Betaproteobacteria bacterium]